jgi:hypothetical protein
VTLDECRDREPDEERAGTGDRPCEEGRRSGNRTPPGKRRRQALEAIRRTVGVRHTARSCRR